MDLKLILTYVDMIIIGMSLGYVVGNLRGWDEGKKMSDDMWQKSFNDLLKAVANAIKSTKTNKD